MTVASSAPETAPDSRHPLAELLAELPTDTELIRGVLTADLADLQAKLPAALARTGGVAPESDEWLAARVADAQALLRSRLLEVPS